VQQETGQSRRLVCLAAPREQVMRYIELAKRCRLELVGMHSEPLCVLRAFDHLGEAPNEAQAGASCFVDLGAATSKVVIGHGGELTFTKTIQTGGDEAVRAIAKARSIGFDEAREAYLAGAPGEALEPAPDAAAIEASSATEAPDSQSTTEGTSAESAGQTAVATAPGPDPAAGPDSEALTCVIEELGLCLRYHARLFPETPVQRLVFLGAGAHQRERCRAIAEQLSLPASIGDPLARLDQPAGVRCVGQAAGPYPAWSVAKGLCLSEANL